MRNAERDFGAASSRRPGDPEGTGMPRFRITESLRTGIPELDKDHEQLIDHINAIAEVEGAAGSKETLEALERFRAHLVRHFLIEENNLMEVSYPRIEAHRKHHAEILAALDRLMDDIRRNEVLEAPAAHICYHELVSAVLFRDMQFVNWLADRQMDRAIGDR